MFLYMKPVRYMKRTGRTRHAEGSNSSSERVHAILPVCLDSSSSLSSSSSFFLFRFQHSFIIFHFVFIYCMRCAYQFLYFDGGGSASVGSAFHFLQPVKRGK